MTNYREEEMQRFFKAIKCGERSGSPDRGAILQERKDTTDEESSKSRDIRNFSESIDKAKHRHRTRRNFINMSCKEQLLIEDHAKIFLNCYCGNIVV
jgi:hypothetical protein